MLTIDDLGKRKPYTYKEIEEKKGGYDEKRVHFVGLRNRGDYKEIEEIDYPDYWNVPTEPNIAGLMESEEDNKTERMY